MVEGVQRYMAAGESTVLLTSPNMEISVRSILVTNSANITLVATPTASQRAVGQIKPKVTLGPRGLTQCLNLGSYVYVTLVEWGINPYADSRSVKSPLLRLSSVAQATDVIAPSSQITTQGQGNGKGEGEDRNTYTLPGVPAYTLTIQYSSIQNFSFSAGAAHNTAIRSRLNYTLPACKQYDGTAYVPCKGCNISSYTNYNVTYSCYDITQLCPKVVTRRGRRLSVENNNDDEDGNDDVVVLKGTEELDTLHRRHLAGIDDITVPTTYGVLVDNVLAEFSSVLSANPFARLPSPVVLTFVGCLSGFIFIMLLYLLRKDKDEKMFKSYVKAEGDLKARKLLAEDIRTGSKGDRGAIYRHHLSTCRKESQGSTVMSSLSRTSRAVTDSWYKKGSTSTKYPSIFDSSYYPSSFDCGSDIEGDYDDESDTASCEEQFTDDKHCATEATVTEFLYKLFPGYAIFSKQTSVLNLVFVNHDYFKMFGGSNMGRTRTVRFLQLITVVLVSLFADTLFFGVMYPSDVCEVHRNQVMSSGLLPVPLIAERGLLSTTNTRVDLHVLCLYTVLYCTVLCGAVPSYLILYCTILLYYTTPHHTIPH